MLLKSPLRRSAMAIGWQEAVTNPLTDRSDRSLPKVGLSSEAADLGGPLFDGYPSNLCVLFLGVNNYTFVSRPTVNSELRAKCECLGRLGQTRIESARGAQGVTVTLLKTVPPLLDRPLKRTVCGPREVALNFQMAERVSVSVTVPSVRLAAFGKSIATPSSRVVETPSRLRPLDAAAADT
jgi:hypothetical protein